MELDEEGPYSGTVVMTKGTWVFTSAERAGALPWCGETGVQEGKQTVEAVRGTTACSWHVRILGAQGWLGWGCRPCVLHHPPLRPDHLPAAQFLCLPLRLPSSQASGFQFRLQCQMHWPEIHKAELWAWVSVVKKGSGDPGLQVTGWTVQGPVSQMVRTVGGRSPMGLLQQGVWALQRVFCVSPVLMGGLWVLVGVVLEPIMGVATPSLAASDVLGSHLWSSSWGLSLQRCCTSGNHYYPTSNPFLLWTERGFWFLWLNYVSRFLNNKPFLHFWKDLNLVRVYSPKILLNYIS